MDELADYLIPILEQNGSDYKNREYLKQVIFLMKERIENMLDLYEFAKYMFAKPEEFDFEALKKNWKENTQEIMNSYLIDLQSVNDWTHAPLHDFTKAFAKKGIKLKEIIHPLRMMLTGQNRRSRNVRKMEVLGKQECISE